MRNGPERPALADATRTLSYGALDALMDRIAASLQRDGLACRRRDRHLRGLERQLRRGVPGRAACRRRGRAAGPRLHAGQPGADDRGRRARASCSSTRPRPRSSGRPTRRRHPAHRARRLGGAGARFEDWLAPAGARPAAVEPQPASPFNIIYSSGTTGTPKGIVQPHGMRWVQLQRGASYDYEAETVVP